MINDIKEMIDKIKKCLISGYDMDIISREEIGILWDYITNLQEENKRLKEYQESYRKEIDYWRIHFANNEEKIDKAIEYIKQHCEIVRNLKENTDKIGKVEGIPLLNILEGSDK